jgi:hypothetical protein
VADWSGVLGRLVIVVLLLGAICLGVKCEYEWCRSLGLTQSQCVYYVLCEGE